MPHAARDKAVESFGKEGSKVKIMIASLKCGGIGCEYSAVKIFRFTILIRRK